MASAEESVPRENEGRGWAEWQRAQRGEKDSWVGAAGAHRPLRGSPAGDQGHSSLSAAPGLRQTCRGEVAVPAGLLTLDCSTQGGSLKVSSTF